MTTLSPAERAEMVREQVLRSHDWRFAREDSHLEDNGHRTAMNGRIKVIMADDCLRVRDVPCAEDAVVHIQPDRVEMFEDGLFSCTYTRNIPFEQLPEQIQDLVRLKTAYELTTDAGMPVNAIMKEPGAYVDRLRAAIERDAAGIL